MNGFFWVSCYCKRWWSSTSRKFIFRRVRLSLIIVWERFSFQETTRVLKLFLYFRVAFKQFENSLVSRKWHRLKTYFNYFSISGWLSNEYSLLDMSTKVVLANGLIQLSLACLLSTILWLHLNNNFPPGSCSFLVLLIICC